MSRLCLIIAQIQNKGQNVPPPSLSNKVAYNKGCAQVLLPNIFLALGHTKKWDGRIRPNHSLATEMDKVERRVCTILSDKIQSSNTRSSRGMVSSHGITTPRTATAAEIVHTVFRLRLIITLCSYV